MLLLSLLPEVDENGSNTGGLDFIPLLMVKALCDATGERKVSPP